MGPEKDFWDMTTFAQLLSATIKWQMEPSKIKVLQYCKGKTQSSEMGASTVEDSLCHIYIPLRLTIRNTQPKV